MTLTEESAKLKVMEILEAAQSMGIHCALYDVGGVFMEESRALVDRLNNSGFEPYSPEMSQYLTHMFSSYDLQAK